jgi:hypothetical protein
MLDKKILKFVWILCCVFVLFISLTQYESGASSDNGVFLVYSMLVLAFPASLLVAGLITLMVLLQESLGVPLLDLIESNRVGLCVMWLSFCIAGYLQWFVMLPWLWRKWKSRKPGSDH